VALIGGQMVFCSKAHANGSHARHTGQLASPLFRKPAMTVVAG
jgi:hypothetical protein